MYSRGRRFQSCPRNRRRPEIQGFPAFLLGGIPDVLLGSRSRCQLLLAATGHLQALLLPAYPAISYPSFVVGFVAEVGLAVWLLIMAVKVVETEAALPG
jgi:hypothetical protein